MLSLTFWVLEKGHNTYKNSIYDNYKTKVAICFNINSLSLHVLKNGQMQIL
jgi:hypothetical protein